MSGNSVSATYTLRTSPNPNLKSHGVLYSFPASIAATMARFTMSIIPFPHSEGGEAKTGGQEFEITTRDVNILGPSEQLKEEYLCDLNPNGSVPTLTIENDSSSPYPSNPSIVEHLITLFPTLAPEPHRSEIISLIKELHAHKLFPISNGIEGGRERLATQRKNLETLLARSDISDRYRSALDSKMRGHEDKEASCQPDAVQAQLDSIRQYVEKICAILEKNATEAHPTIYGTTELTALDAQVAPLLVRLQMTGKDEYLGGENSPLRRFLAYVRGLQEWKAAAKGFHNE